MLALMQENGPFLMQGMDQSLKWNEYSWIKSNNVVWIDNPAGVGYSICTKDACKNNDDQTGVDNLQVLEKFYERYPELKTNDLYISGESYAGIYVPQFAKNIHLSNANNATSFPLKGIMVGNGVTNWTYDTLPASMEFAYQRGLIDTELHNKYKEMKCDITKVAPLNASAEPAECNDYVERFSKLTEELDVYNIYAKCYKKP